MNNITKGVIFFILLLSALTFSYYIDTKNRIMLNDKFNLSKEASVSVVFDEKVEEINIPKEVRTNITIHLPNEYKERINENNFCEILKEAKRKNELYIETNIIDINFWMNMENKEKIANCLGLI